MGANDDSMTDLVRGAIQDARELIQDEIALARTELRHELARLRSGVATVAAAAVAALLAVTFLLTTIAWGLAAWFAWPVWAGFGVVTAAMIVITLILGLTARARLRGGEHMARTRETLKEDLQWMRARTRS